jgi:bifunctional non-homologous end joining protein LigD
MSQRKEHIVVDGQDVPVSNLDKVLFPKGRITKAHVIDYYLRISRHILPHLRGRPVTLKRYPNGALGDFFYEKDAPAFTPAWVETFPVPRKESRKPINYILVNDRATLAWLANLANLEIHPFLHRVPKIEIPTSVVFDLDPGKGADVLTCAHVAFLLRDLLQALGLKSFAKVSGSKGLQVYAPLNGDATYELTRPFAKAVADLLSREHPKLVVAEMAKTVRTGKVFVDWSQNSDFKTTVGVYSLRAKTEEAFVSVPVTWQDLEAGVKAKTADALYFGIDATFQRVEKLGDLFAPVLTTKQKLPSKVVEHLSGNAPRSLASYREKRDFTRTAEPAPAPIQISRHESGRRFVIQKHAASHLHYDFRLEMDDVLKSWAVPKGPPYVKGEKRLAMPTEDHPLDYLEFEGIIPKGQYGGGTVMVWDIGTYELINGEYAKGYLHFRLSGKKLKGEWQLMRWRKESKRDTWLLAKAGASMRAVSKKRDDSSAVSERSMKQIADLTDSTWQSYRAERRRA